MCCLLGMAWVSPVRAQDATPPPALAYTAEGIEIAFFSDGIRQGRAGLVQVRAENLRSVQAQIFDQTIDFFTLPNDPAHYGFIAVSFTQAIRDYDLTLEVTFADQTRRAVLVPLSVRSGNFLRQDVTLRPDQLALLDPQLEQREFALLDQLSAPRTPMPMWAGDGFRLPVDAELTSPFGVVRLFNGTLETRHTGWDFTGGMGDLMTAAASGRVVFAGNMDIRGGYVLIDHGYGVYTGYAHLSVIHVVQGQFVRQGQIIGLSGNTGRSSDPHIHFEMRVNNQWVDPVDFIRMWLPS